MKIIIDGKEYECQSGQTVYDVAKDNNIHIPTLCLNELNTGNRTAGCRICVVEIINQGDDPKIESSCTLSVSDGLNVSTKSRAVYNERRTVLELLLSEHQQDCRNCIMSGNCPFAELCLEYDIDGVSVCAECPNREEGCFLSRDVLCIGPITFANCDAFCTRNGDPCEGCFSILSNRDLLIVGLEALDEAGFTRKEVLEASKVFSFDEVEILEDIMKEEGLFNEDDLR